jgi:hypothetical protein
MLPDLSNEAMVVFLCEYTHETSAQRAPSTNPSRTQEGGPLPVESVREIVIGTTDFLGSQDRWQRLLDPLAASSSGVWELEPGPAIRLVPSEKDGILGLVIKVRSLEQARQFLQEQGLLGLDEEEKITIAGPFLKDLNITLVEVD